MRLSVVALGWRPAEYWAASLTELFDAFEAVSDARQSSTGGATTPTSDEMTALMEKYG